MHPRTALSAMAGLALAASAAFAQTPPPAAPDKPGPMMHWRHHDKGDMAKHMAEMCKDRYAQSIGKLAYLEAKLNLTAKQKPLFERWKGALLSAVKEQTDKCGTIKMPEGMPSLVDHLKMHQKMIQAHASIIEAQMPALEALNASLDEAQQGVLTRTAIKMMMHQRMHMMHRMHGDGMRGMHGRGQMFEKRIVIDDDDDAPAPPPPPAD